MNSLHPFHPIIYVRGFAATQSEIDETVADPYMGFNLGSTKARLAWTGEIKRFYFESPLVRLMSDHQYEDVFRDGIDLVANGGSDRPIQYRSIVIYRYYDEASTDFGDGETKPIEHFAKGLSRLIATLRRRIAENPANRVAEPDVRVHLVAHSMGGLVCRAFLQNPMHDPEGVRGAVDKLFTYATPHRGIDLRLVRNVPGWLTFGDVNNFNHERMAEYLGLEPGTDVARVDGFPADRVFNLVGTAAADYRVLGGLSAWAAGEASDGLVRIDNATTHGIDTAGRETQSPRAFVHRSHSGQYGIVNSEEGYQNLVRFLFGTLRVDGILELDSIALPAEVQAERDKGKQVRASYQFEVAVSVRGCQWQMTRREVRENSAMFRTYDQLFPEGANGVRYPDRAQSPHLFSVFLDSKKSVKASRSVCFAFDVKVLVPDYEVDGLLFLKRHFDGGFILRELILVEAFPEKGGRHGWRIKYGYQDDNPGKPGITAETYETAEEDGIEFSIPLEQKTRPGLLGRLRVIARPWR